MNKTLTSYPCPLCQVLMLSALGTVLNPHDGLTVFCDNPECKVEVFGHADKEKDAFDIINQKYTAHIKNKNI